MKDAILGQMGPSNHVRRQPHDLQLQVYFHGAKLSESWYFFPKNGDFKEVCDIRNFFGINPGYLLRIGPIADFILAVNQNLVVWSEVNFQCLTKGNLGDLDQCSWWQCCEFKEIVTEKTVHAWTVEGVSWLSDFSAHPYLNQAWLGQVKAPESSLFS